MDPKKNPLLAQIERKYQGLLAANTEIDLIAHLLTVNEDLQVGPGRAGKLCNDFIAKKLELVEIINSDYGKKKGEGDKQLSHTKRTIAKRLRKMFSKEDWQKVRVLFPMLEEYWDIEV